MPRFRQDKETPGGQALLPGDVSCVPVPDSGKDGKPARTGVAALQDGLRPLCPQSLSLQTLSPNPLSGASAGRPQPAGSPVPWRLRS